MQNAPSAKHNSEKLAAIFAEMLANTPLEGKPNSEVMAMGELMRNWLQTEMADGESHVDAGAGFSSYDLWVKFGGKELYMNICESERQRRSETE